MPTPPPADFDAAYVTARLEEAGATLMSLRERGCFPAQYRAFWPETLQVETEDEPVHIGRFDGLHSAGNTDLPRLRPSARSISEMDEALGWVAVLPWTTPLQWQARRLVHLRALVWPNSDRADPHVWTWRRLGKLFDVHNETVRDRHARAVDLMVARLNRGEMPSACVGTLARIQSFAKAKAARRADNERII